MDPRRSSTTSLTPCSLQLDLLPETVNLTETATSLVPVSLKGKVQPPMTPENIEPNAVLPSSRRSSSPTPSRSVEKNRTTSTSPRLSPALPLIKPERRVSEEETRHNHHNAAWIFSAPLPGGRALRVVFPKSVVVRTTKSVILAAKVNNPFWQTPSMSHRSASRCFPSPPPILPMANFTP